MCNHHSNHRSILNRNRNHIQRSHRKRRNRQYPSSLSHKLIRYHRWDHNKDRQIERWIPLQASKIPPGLKMI